MAHSAENLPQNPGENRTRGTDVNDTAKIGGRLERQRELLDEAEIPETDREAIRKFFRYRRSGGTSRNTIRADLSSLRNASERADVSLLEMGQTDAEEFFALLVTPKSEGGYGLSRGKGGMFNYRRALRVFFKWLDSRDDYGAYPFWEEIETPRQEVERQPVDERLTWDDVQELKSTASRGRNGARDRALIGMLAEGHRVTAVAQLRVGDVDPFGDDPTFRLNDSAEDGYKDMENVERTLLYCAADLRQWLSQAHPDNAHPDGPRDAAPLWPIQNYDPTLPTRREADDDARTVEDCALSNDGIRSVLERTAEKVGLEKPVNPHNFRHAFHTQMANDPNVDPRDQQHHGGWADQTMLDHYDESTAEEKRHALRSGLGLSSEEPEGANTTPDPHPCWNCQVQLTTEDYCPSCGEPQAVDVRLKRREARERSREGISADADDPDKTMARAKVLEALDDPRVWQVIEERLED